MTTKRKIRRRQLDLVRTLNAYEMRIRSIPRNKLLELEDAWLSSFELWNTVLASQFEEEYNMRRDNPNLDNCVLRLASVCLEKGINIRGCTSERKRYGEFVASLADEKPREEQKIIFCGAHSSFHHKKRHPLFSIQPHDKRYYKFVSNIDVTPAPGDVSSVSDTSGGGEGENSI